MPHHPQTIVSFPLSFAQERLWFLDRFSSERPLYNLSQARRLRGALDADRLERALQAVVRRHDVLRTFVDTVDDVPVQVVTEDIAALRRIDLRAWPGPFEAREAEAHRLAAEAASRRFDLARPPLLLLSLIQLAEADHLLVLVVHHIVFDGWSMGMFWQELSRLYEAELRGESSPLAALPMQYGDYARAQRESVDDEMLARQLAFWKDRLEGAPALLDLPTDLPRPPEQRFRGGRHVLTVSRELADALARVSRESGATLFMTLLGAFQLLLLRHTGETDLVVGTAIDNRQAPELESMIGYCANTLALRVDLSGNPTFKDLLRRVRDTALDAYSNRDVPFERLVQEIRPVRSLNRTPVFQTMFVLQHGRGRSAFTLGEATGSSYAPESGDVWCDLAFWVADVDSGLVATLDYDADLFLPETIARWAARFECLLEGIVANPRQPIATLPLLPPAERAQIQVTWNETNAPYPAEQTIHGLIAACVARTPDAPAVVAEDASWTYRELDARAETIAAVLRQHGVVPDTRVGVCVERSALMVAAVLGVLKAGGAYVPIDPTHPAERTTLVLEDARAPIVLTESALLERCGHGSMEAICLDRLTFGGVTARASDSSGAMAQGLAAHGLASRKIAPQLASPRNLAYVLYTSGSTGRPKGVQVEHRSVVNLLTAMQRTLEVSAKDVLLAVTTLAFDIAGLELWMPLITGATVVIAPRATAMDPDRLARALETSGATMMQATPATWQMLVEAGWSGSPGLTLLCGGEALPRELAARLRPCGAALWNLYGPTETTIWSTARQIREAEPVDLGRPLANTELFVLDERGELVPIGVPGELLIGGAGLARGYLDRPDLTAERFVPHPFAPGARLYRTGDLVRWTPAGTLTFLGRRDHQVKLRGFRLELGEIEARLRAHASVRDAIVLLREDAGQERRLVAYIVPASEQPEAIDLSALRDHLKRGLPDYAIPSAIVSVAAWPLSPNGKIDRRQLLALDVPIGQAGVPETPARTTMERRVAKAWREVLGLARVSVHDNFFEVGGHSLLMVKLHARLRESMPQPFEVVDLFRYPTIHTQAAFFSRAATAGASQATRARPRATPRWNADARRAARGRGAAGPEDAA